MIDVHKVSRRPSGHPRKTIFVFLFFAAVPIGNETWGMYAAVRTPYVIPSYSRFWAFMGEPHVHVIDILVSFCNGSFAWQGSLQLNLLCVIQHLGRST